MSETPDGQRPRLHALMLRLVVWGSIGLTVLLYVVDQRSLWPQRSPVPATPTAAADLAPEAHEPPGPNWPHLRGPTYDAHSAETGLADAWPPEGPPALWSREMGRGYSAFIAVGDRVYTQHQSNTDQALLCLDADTGQTVWEHRYGWPYEPGGMYPGPRATPTYSGGYLYFAAPDGLVGCLRAADGRPVWSRNVCEEFRGRGTEFGYACTPLVEDGKVILPVGGPDAAVVALRATDGATAWASGQEPASYASALPITFRERRLVIAFLQNALTAYDLASGRLLWHKGYSRGYDEHAAMPVYEEPHLMVMLPFRAGADLYRLEAEPDRDADENSDRLAATLIGHRKELSNDVASSVLVDGHVYGFDLREAQTNRHRPSRGAFRCLEFLSGTVRWSSDRIGHATIVAADGKLYLLNDRGEVLLARATPERYDELGRVEVFPGERCWTAPVLARGRLYLRSPTRAVCLYVGRPQQLALAQRERVRPVSEVRTARAIDWTGLIGGEREFPYDAPTRNELLRWYGMSLLAVLLPAGLSAGLVGGLTYRRRPGAACRTGWIAFWCCALVLGVAATPLCNRLGIGFVFTWPVTLFAAQQMCLWAVAATGSGLFFGQTRHVLVESLAEKDSRPLGSAWLLAGAIWLWFAAGLAYFDLCRRLTLAITWVFLIGFGPSWILAYPAARQLHQGRHPLRVAIWTFLAFTLYFWTSCLFLLCRTPGAD